VKRLISAVAVLLFIAAAAPVFALDSDPHARRATANIVDEVIRMSQAGVADEDIVAYVHKTHDRYDVSADDIIAMTDAKVSKAVIHAVVGEADVRNGDGDRRREVREVRTVVEPAVYVGSPWFWDPFYYYDPFWYQPRLSLSFGFGHYYGGYHGYRGGYRGHGGGGHHHR
jgi:hypothetical protein